MSTEFYSPIGIVISAALGRDATLLDDVREAVKTAGALLVPLSPG
jgi:hypothetical protein